MNNDSDLHSMTKLPGWLCNLHAVVALKSYLNYEQLTSLTHTVATDIDF